MRQEIIFYDYEFNPLGRASGVTDIYHKELYNGIGTFEAGLAADEPVARLLLERDYVVAIWEGRQAIVTSAQADDASGKFRIFGRTPNWLLEKRACPNFGHRTGTPFELAHDLVGEVWGDSLAVGTGRELEAEQTTFWRNVYNPLSEVVADCLDRADGGHRVVFDLKNRQWRFETYVGKKSSYLFSEDRHNIHTVSIRHSVLDHFNGGFYTTDDDSEVWNELASNKEGLYKWTTRLEGGASSAQAELDKKKIEDEIDFSLVEPLPEGAYALGDIVKAERRCGGLRRTQEMRVVAVERWAERGDVGERPQLKAI